MLLVGTACDNEGARRAAPAAVVESEARNTMRLSIKLRDGFSNSAVSIRVDGAEVYKKSALSTDLTISLAEEVRSAGSEGSRHPGGFRLRRPDGGASKSTPAKRPSSMSPSSRV